MRKVPTLPGQASPKALGMNSKNPMPAKAAAGMAKAATGMAKKPVAMAKGGMAKAGYSKGGAAKKPVAMAKGGMAKKKK
jgi:hypothetical protein